jgi:hypothetical protein
MLKNELKSNDILIPVNIESVFTIALIIQNYLWSKSNLPNDIDENIRLEQYNKYNNNNPNKIAYKHNKNDDYYNEYSDNGEFKQFHSIFLPFYNKARDLESKNFESYGSYWTKFKKKKILHIKISKKLKKILINNSIESKNNKFNIPNYNINKDNFYNKIKNYIKELMRFLKFINTRFDENKNDNYIVFLDKIYVHVLANIIGVNFYLTMEELIIKYYINSDINLMDRTKIDGILKLLNNLLINNKLDNNNINFLYIKAQIPESVLKDKIKEILTSILLNNNELINNFETIVLPRYRDLYKITYKYLKMFMSNYHKFIYNQYHGLNILLLLLDKL